MLQIRKGIRALVVLLVLGCAPEEEDSQPVHTYSVSGTVTGLNSGSVTLQNNSVDDLVIYQSGSQDVFFSFPTQISEGGSYRVSTKIHPNIQVCIVNEGSGTVNDTVDNVSVVCSSESYNLGGTITGLDGTVVLQNNNGDDLKLTQNGSFAFKTKVSKGSDYYVTVLTQPLPLTCSVTNNRGIITAAITGVKVNCSIHTLLLNGTAGGIGSTTLTLQHGIETESITDDGTDNKSFSLETPVAYGGGYNIAIPSQPDNRTCTVVNGHRQSITELQTDLRAVCWNYIDNVTSGGINISSNLNATSPTVSIFNEKLYTAWVESNGTNDVIRISRHDNGTTWTQIDNNSVTGTNGIISSSGTQASEPFLVLESGFSIMYLLWVDKVNNVDSIWYGWNAASTDDPILVSSWYPAQSLNYSTTSNSSNPYAITSDGKLFAIWTEQNSVRQIRVRDVKDVATINTWLDGGGNEGINHNTSNHAANPVMVLDSSVFYAAWSEENSTSSDNVSQIRVKKLDRSKITNNTAWVSIDGDSSNKGINYNYLYNADKPDISSFNSKIYITWQELNSHNKTQIRVAYLNSTNTWTFVDGGESETGVNSMIDEDGNENATYPKLHVYDSQLYLIWTQENSVGKQIRIAKYNDNDSSPSWQMVDRFDEYGMSRFGLNYNVIKDASNPALSASSTKLYAVWSETDNTTGKSHVRVVENPM